MGTSKQWLHIAADLRIQHNAFTFFFDIYQTSQISTRTSHKFISDVTAMLKSTSLNLNRTK